MNIPLSTDKSFLFRPQSTLSVSDYGEENKTSTSRNIAHDEGKEESTHRLSTELAPERQAYISKLP